MTEFLLRIFVKNHRDCDRSAVRAAIGKFGGKVGIFCNCLLFIAKFIVGIFSGSVAIMADAVNNLSDASSSVITLWGFRMAQKPADAEHPYGHARYEYIAGLIVAALIFVIGFELLFGSVKKILNPVSVEITIVTFVILFLSVAVKLWMMVFFRTLGKKIGSSTLKVTSVDSRNDVIASASVIVGCGVEYFWGIKVDGFIGLAVAIFILYSGVGIARETVSPLLGKRADAESVSHLYSLVRSHEEILDIHDLLVHDYGPGQCFASLHAEMDAEMDPLCCHDLIDEIECEALKELNIHLVVHYDPVVVNDEEWTIMRETVKDIVRAIDPGLSIHDFRIVRGASLPKLVFDVAVPYTMCSDPDALTEQINNALQERNEDYITVIRFDRI